MSKKTLLNESQVRQFMKLAKLEPLASGFVEGLTTERETRPPGGPRASHGRGDDQDPNKRENVERELTEEDDDAEKLRATEDELGDMDDDVHDKDEEIDDLEADLGAAAPEAGEGDGRMISVDDFLGALESALESAMGDEVEIDASEMSDEEDEVEADVELDAADDMEMDTEMEMDDEMLAEEEGSKKGEYRRKDKDGKVGHRAGEGKDGHYKDYEGPEGGNKGDESKTHPGKKDYEKNESHSATDDLAVTKRVAARILKSALAKK
mgnify:CR=1 FL=1